MLLQLGRPLASPAPPLLHCEHSLLGFSKIVPPSTQVQKSTPTSSPQQAESKGFGQGLPSPRHVPSTSFLTTSTAYSSWVLRACFSSPPTMGFITFQAGSRVSSCCLQPASTLNPSASVSRHSRHFREPPGDPWSRPLFSPARWFRTRGFVLFGPARVFAARSPAFASSPGRLPKESTCVPTPTSCLAAQGSPALTRSLLPRLPREARLHP